jgi:hypothetical protein
MQRVAPPPVGEDVEDVVARGRDVGVAGFLDGRFGRSE